MAAPTQPNSAGQEPIQSAAPTPAPPAVAHTAWSAIRVVLILLAVFMAACIAWNSRPAVHPDEQMHIDAFRYFENAWLRPEPGSDLVLYSGFGWSRVFTGEVVYEVYGKIGRLIKSIYTPPDGWPDTYKLGRHYQRQGLVAYRLYRLINVCLLALTLSWLFFARCKWCPGWVLALTILAIPQSIYIYAYANSDAWGLSACLLLFITSAQLAERPISQWTWPRLLLWSLLLIALLLSKTGFLIGIILPLAVVFISLIRQRREIPSPRWRWLSTRVFLPIIGAYLIAAAYQPYIRPFAGQYRAAIWAARETKADYQFRGNMALHWGGKLAGKGYTMERMLAEKNWFYGNNTSFYSRFGGWSVEHPDWTFLAAFWLFIAGLTFTLASRIRWSRDIYDWTCFALAPAIFAANLYGSLWHSLHIDFQPQGRYLFACIIPLALCFAGALPFSRGRWRAAHLLTIALAVTLSFFILWNYGVNSDTLNR